jgi:hypothetical protein
MKRTETNRVCTEKNNLWINNKIKQIEETSNKNETKIFLKKCFLINNNWCYQYFVRAKVVTYCQNMETFYKDGNNIFVIYKA